MKLFSCVVCVFCGNGDYFIDGYDPNQPDTGTPPNSRIHVRPDNTWSFHGNFDGDSDWGGDMNALAAVSSRAIPLHPTLPTLESLIEVYFDSGAAQTAQVSDAAGRTLFAADGSVNRDPATRLPNAAPFPDLTGAAQPVNAMVVSSTNAFTYTLAGTGSGVYSSTLFSGGVVASLQNISATSAISDHVMIDPGASRLTFHTDSGQKALTARLIGQAGDRSLHTVTLNTRSFQAGQDSLSFDATRTALTYQHTVRQPRPAWRWAGWGRWGRFPGQIKGNQSIVTATGAAATTTTARRHDGCRAAPRGDDAVGDQ